MRKISILIILIASLLLIAKSGHTFSNEPKGFFALDWGSSAADLKKVYKDSELIKDGKIQWYIPNSGYAQFSGVMARITYQYFNDELFFVNIYYNNSEDGEKLVSALKVTYGDPDVIKEDSFEWRGSVTSITISKTNRVISFWSNDIMKKSAAPK